MKKILKNSFKYFIVFMLLFLISGCSNEPIPHNKFTLDERVANNFLNNMYSNDQSKINFAVNKWVTKNNKWIIHDKFSRGKFSIPHFQRIEILKSNKIVDHDYHVDLVLTKVYGKKIDSNKNVTNVVRVNLIYIVNHKVFLDIMSNDSDDSDDYNRLMKNL